MQFLDFATWAKIVPCIKIVECEPKKNIPKTAKLAEIQPFIVLMDYLIMSRWLTLFDIFFKYFLTDFNVIIQSFEPSKWAALDLHSWLCEVDASFCKELFISLRVPCKIKKTKSLHLKCRSRAAHYFWVLFLVLGPSLWYVEMRSTDDLWISSVTNALFPSLL